MNRLRPKSMEGFLIGLRKRNYAKSLLSLHLLPITGSIILALTLHLYNVPTIFSALTLGFGGLTTAMIFAFLPIPILGPIGGKYNVAITFLDGNFNQSIPPLAIYYPTNEIPNKEGIPYFPFNDSRFINGLSTYGKVPRYFLKDFALVRLRVIPDAKPISIFNKNGNPLPIIIFSHGLSAFHTLYSCLLSDIAARGAIVVSIGHCDGSASFMRETNEGKNEINFKCLGWEIPVREAQLTQRVREMRQTIKRISEKEFWHNLKFESEDIYKFLSEPLQLHLSGHSFGGATALATALHEEQEISKYFVKSVFVFDPWYLPLQNEFFYQPIVERRKTYTTPTLMIHSETWVNTEESWEFFKKVTNTVLAQSSLKSLSEIERRSYFITERTGDTNHLSVCDVSILSPIIHGSRHTVIPPRVQIVEWANALLHFVKKNTHETEIKTEK